MEQLIYCIAVSCIAVMINEVSFLFFILLIFYIIDIKPDKKRIIKLLEILLAGKEFIKSGKSRKKGFTIWQ